MKIEYRKLVSSQDFSQCIDLQKSLFGLSDVDIISPLLLQLIARESPPMGVLQGAFNISEKEQELVGFAISMATFQRDSMYLTMIGVKPSFRNQGIGINLLLKLRETALQNKINNICWVFEPLDRNLAHFYVQSLGALGIHYHEDRYHLQKANEDSHVPMDNMLFKWDLKSYSTRHRSHSVELLGSYPIASKDSKPDVSHVLVEIPTDFDHLKKEDVASAKHWRHCTRDIFMHYLNHRNYIVYDCLTFEENLNERSFYLLKAQ